MTIFLTMESKDLIYDFIVWYEANNPQTVMKWKKRIDTDNIQGSFIEFLEDGLDTYRRSPELMDAKVRVIWALVRFGARDNYKLLRGYLDYLINKIDQRSMNAGQSKYDLFSTLFDRGVDARDSLNFKLENLIFGEGVAKEVTKEILATLENEKTKLSGVTTNISEGKDTKENLLRNNLTSVGFLNIPKVAELKDESKEKLLSNLSKNGLPYAIAMFDHLGFIKYLDEQHFSTKYKMNQEMSKWFNSDKNGRSVRGNIASLVQKDNKRYTAYLHKDIVINDYNLLK